MTKKSYVAPNNYIPAFLQLTFPYAQEDDTILVFFKYYSGSTSVRGNEFTFTDGSWVAHQSKLKFGHDGNSWVPDNTIKYTLTAADYTLIAAELGETYPDATSSMSNYGNMDRRAGNVAEWTDPMVLEAVAVVLNDIDPSAAEEQKYIVTIEIYNGSNTTEDFAVIKMGGEWVYQN